jgi:hypothetical protein
MNLFETLQELKKIQPDPIFSENSRRAILASSPLEPVSPRRIFIRSLAAAGSLVLAGALIFVIAGGLSATNLAPQFSSIDPTSLHAEAQAIDTQINLLNVNYPYPESTASNELVPAAGTNSGSMILSNASSSALAAIASSTPTSTMSVDEILQGLSQ